jgi:GcrA cell cycle regulator
MPAPNAKSWPPPDDDLVKLVTEGFVYSQLADHFGVTRSAIAGRMSRIWAKRNGEKPQPKNVKRLPKAKPGSIAPSPKAFKPRERQRSLASWENNGPKKEPYQAREFDVADAKHIGLLELTATTCRWPFGAGPPFTYCGCRCGVLVPYCEAHMKAAHNG